VDQAAVQELIQVPSGWTPTTWRERLLYLADRCQRIVPARAAELRAAAALLETDRVPDELFLSVPEAQGGCREYG
jgi:hypothetical protein